MPDDNQLEFDFDAVNPVDGDYHDFIYPELIDEPDLPDQETDQGYRRFQEAEREKIRRISREWSIPLWKEIEFEIKTVPGVHRGKVALAEYPQPPYDSHREDLHLYLVEPNQLSNPPRPRFEFMRSEIAWIRLAGN